MWAPTLVNEQNTVVAQEYWRYAWARDTTEIPMRTTILEQRRFTSRAATASSSVDQASSARRGQPGTPSVTTRGDAVTTKGCSRASLRSGRSRHSLAPSSSVGDPQLHTGIQSAPAPGVNDLKSSTSHLWPAPRSLCGCAQKARTSATAQILATLPAGYIGRESLPDRSVGIGESGPGHDSDDGPENSAANLVASVIGIVVCLFTAVTGGLPIKWVLQLLGVIQ